MYLPSLANLTNTTSLIHSKKSAIEVSIIRSIPIFLSYTLYFGSVTLPSSQVALPDPPLKRRWKAGIGWYLMGFGGRNKLEVSWHCSQHDLKSISYSCFTWELWPKKVKVSPDVSSDIPQTPSIDRAWFPCPVMFHIFSHHPTYISWMSSPTDSCLGDFSKKKTIVGT